MTDLACLLVPLVMLADSAFQSDLKSVKEAEKTGNFMEDEQWLSTISQYSRKIKHWNRFRDVSPAALPERRTSMRSKELIMAPSCTGKALEPNPLGHRSAAVVSKAENVQVCRARALRVLYKLSNLKCYLEPHILFSSVLLKNSWNLFFFFLSVTSSSKVQYVKLDWSEELPERCRWKLNCTQTLVLHCSPAYLNTIKASVLFAAGTDTLHHTLLNVGHLRWVSPGGFANRFEQLMWRICNGLMVTSVHLLDGANQVCRGCWKPAGCYARWCMSLSVNAWTYLCPQTCEMITNDHSSTRRTVQSDYVPFNWVVIDPWRL